MVNTSNVKNKKTIDILIDFFLFIFLLTKTGFFKSPYLEYISLFIFLLLIVNKIIITRKVIITKQVVGYTLFGVFACLSYFWSLNKSSALKVIPNIVALIIFLFSLSCYIDSKEKLIKLIKYVVISNTLVAIKIILLYFFYSGSSATRINDITGIYFNTVGQVIGFSVIFSYYLYKISNNKKYLIMIIPQLIAILFTQSRKSLLIPIFAFIIITLFKRKTIKESLTYLLIILISVFSVVLLSFSNIRVVKDNISEFQNLLQYAVGQQTNDWSINLRQFFIKTGVYIFKNNKIKGIGVNNFSYYVGKYTYYGIERYSHNNYIEMLSCLGLIGFVLYYWVYIYILWNLLKAIVKDRNNILLIISFSFLVVLMVMEWGVVSYTGCLYHTFILICYFNIMYKDKLCLKDFDSNE